MTRMFKTGTSVRVIDERGQDESLPEEHRLVYGDVRLVEDVSPHGWLRVHGSPAYWLPARFEEARPEPPEWTGPEPLEAGQTVLVYARFTGFGAETIAGPGGTPTVEIPVADGLFKTVRHVDPESIRPTKELPPWTRAEPGGRFAIVRSGRLQHSRHEAGGKWLGTDGKWRTWEEVSAMATRGPDPKTLVSDEEKADG